MTRLLGTGVSHSLYTRICAAPLAMLCITPRARERGEVKGTHVVRWWDQVVTPSRKVTLLEGDRDTLGYGTSSLKIGLNRGAPPLCTLGGAMRGIALWLLVALGGLPSAVLGRTLVPFFGSTSGVSRPQGRGPSAEERQASAERARLERELASFQRTETYSADHEIADEADLDEWDEADFSVVRFFMHPFMHTFVSTVHRADARCRPRWRPGFATCQRRPAAPGILSPTLTMPTAGIAAPWNGRRRGCGG
jgi:hypothetical protein